MEGKLGKDSSARETCVHHWIIESHDGIFEGKCKRCGANKVFKKPEETSAGFNNRTHTSKSSGNAPETPPTNVRTESEKPSLNPDLEIMMRHFIDGKNEEEIIELMGVSKQSYMRRRKSLLHEVGIEKDTEAGMRKAIARASASALLSIPSIPIPENFPTTVTDTDRVFLAWLEQGGELEPLTKGSGMKEGQLETTISAHLEVPNLYAAMYVWPRVKNLPGGN